MDDCEAERQAGASFRRVLYLLEHLPRFFLHARDRVHIAQDGSVEGVVLRTGYSSLHLGDSQFARACLRVKPAKRKARQPKGRVKVKGLTTLVYRPIERMAILEVKAARGWSQAETARRFLVKPTTIASWLRRID